MPDTPQLRSPAGGGQSADHHLDHFQDIFNGFPEGHYGSPLSPHDQGIPFTAAPTETGDRYMSSFAEPFLATADHRATLDHAPVAEDSPKPPSLDQATSQDNSWWASLLTPHTPSNSDFSTTQGGVGEDDHDRVRELDNMAIHPHLPLSGDNHHYSYLPHYTNTGCIGSPALPDRRPLHQNGNNMFTGEQSFHLQHGGATAQQSPVHDARSPTISAPTAFTAGPSNEMGLSPRSPTVQNITLDPQGVSTHATTPTERYRHKVADGHIALMKLVLARAKTLQLDYSGEFKNKAERYHFTAKLIEALGDRLQQANDRIQELENMISQSQLPSN